MEQESGVEENGDLFGLDLHAEVLRLRELNIRLAGANAKAWLIALFGLLFGVFCLFKRPEPVRIPVDASGHFYQAVSLNSDDPPDAKITGMVQECVHDLLNHAFHNYQTTVERAIGECFTGGGSESVRQVIYPLLEDVKNKRLNMASSFIIHPFINSRDTTGGRNVFHIQGVIDLGYRGTGNTGSIRPVEYAFQTDVVRVSFDSQPRGIRLQNLVLSKRNNN